MNALSSEHCNKQPQECHFNCLLEGMEKNVMTSNGINNVNTGEMVECNENFAITMARFFSQCSSQAAIDKFGRPAEEAVGKEMKQLHDRSVSYPLDIDSLSDEERRKTLESSMFIKEK